MRSLASRFAALAAVLGPASLAAQVALPPEAGAPAGPSGTAGNGEPSRYDAVLTAAVDASIAGIAAATDGVPAGGHVELTSLATGRTILAATVAGGDGVRLSPGAARALDLADGGGVRVRAVTAGAADAAALRQGGAASPRLDTPESVLRALRRQLPAAVATAAPARATTTRVPRAPRRIATTVMDVAPPPPTTLRIDTTTPATAPATAPAPPPAAPSATVASADVPATRIVPPAATPVATAPAPLARFVVQVAMLPREEAARNAARTLGGMATRAGEGWQVRLGPFTGLPAAQAARDAAVARGYADAAIYIAD